MRALGVHVFLIVVVVEVVVEFPLRRPEKRWLDRSAVSSRSTVGYIDG